MGICGLYFEVVQWKDTWWGFSGEYVPASPDIQSKFNASLAYLSQYPKFGHVIRALTVSPMKIRVRAVADLVSDLYDPTEHLVQWNPRMNWICVDDRGYETGERLSAALTLGHELVHAFGDINYHDRFSKLAGVEDRSFGNAEEAFVITQYEQPFALKFHDGFRRNHLGKGVNVK